MPMSPTAKFYHHGRSPAAWAGSIIGAVGFVVLAVGAVLVDKTWTVAIVGAVLVLLAGLTTMVMKAAGYGQP